MAKENHIGFVFEYIAYSAPLTYLFLKAIAAALALWLKLWKIELGDALLVCMCEWESVCVCVYMCVCVCVCVESKCVNTKKVWQR